MKKALSAIVLLVSLVSCCLPAAGQNSLDAQLCQAVEERRTNAIESLLKHGANIEAQSCDVHETPLIRAVQANNVEMVSLLLKKHANIRATSFPGWTAIYWAAFNGSNDMVRLLLEKGANIEESAGPGAETPLLVAADNDKTDTVQLLLASGANIAARDH